MLSEYQKGLVLKLRKAVENENLVVVSHHPCADGFTARWVVRKWILENFNEEKLDKVVVVDGVHQSEPKIDMFEGKVVLMLDFVYPLNVLKQLIEKVDDIIVLDHHVSTKKEIEPLIDSGMIGGYFDLNHSGCKITWDLLFPITEPPSVLKVIESRDLWKFDVPNTKEISACVFSYDYTFENWDYLMDNKNLQEIISDGIVIERKYNKDINEFNCKLKRYVYFGGSKIPIANIPYTHASDLGNKMLKNEKGEYIEAFSITYFVDTNGDINIGLRSHDKGEDVSVIAKKYGGGGHRNVSGFKIKKGGKLPWVE